MGKVAVRKVFISLGSIIRENDKVRLGPTMRASLGLVKRPHSKRANVAGSVIARRNSVVNHSGGADEAHFGFSFVPVFHSRFTLLLALIDRGISARAITRDATRI